MFSKLLSRKKKEEKSDADDLLDFADGASCTTDKPPDPFNITETAAKKISSLVAEESDAKGLRIFVQGGGCSGFQYGFAFANKIDDDDTKVQQKGASVFVDAMSYQYMWGAEIDYKDDLQGASFVIRNPQATATCGCGSSFAYG